MEKEITKKITRGEPKANSNFQSRGLEEWSRKLGKLGLGEEGFDIIYVHTFNLQWQWTVHMVSKYWLNEMMRWENDIQTANIGLSDRDEDHQMVSL